jgi:BMFP domain-containing protein YqiC
MDQDANEKTESVQDVTSDAETEIRKLVNRHIQNKDDVISEEEFRNLKVGVSSPEEQPSPSENNSTKD